MSVDGAEHRVDLASVDADLFAAGSLDEFLAAGRETWGQVRPRRCRRPARR